MFASLMKLVQWIVNLWKDLPQPTKDRIVDLIVDAFEELFRRFFRKTQKETANG